MLKKWWFWVIVILVVIALAASGSSEEQSTDNASGSNEEQNTDNDSSPLGDYEVEILSYRLSKTILDYEPVVIVKYKFTNNSDEAISFSSALDDNVYQNDIGLNATYMVVDSANYDYDNKSKKLKPGASLEVEVAYELNDTTTPIVVEVSRTLGGSGKKVTKTFNIN